MLDPEALPAEGRYVYAVLPAAGAPTGPLTGIDDAPVEFVERGDRHAFIGHLEDARNRIRCNQGRGGDDVSGAQLAHSARGGHHRGTCRHSIIHDYQR